MKRLLNRRNRLAGSLPPMDEVLRGSIYVRRLRCGKPGCHCAKGEGHEATYLSVTLPGGRTEQISLPKSLVPTAKQWVRNYHLWWEAVEKISAINRDILRQQRETKPRRVAKKGKPRRRST